MLQWSWSAKRPVGLCTGGVLSFLVFFSGCFWSKRQAQVPLPDDFFSQAVIFYHQGEADSAKVCLERLLKKYWNHPQALALLGEIQRNKGTLAGRLASRRNLEQAVALNPENPQMRYHLGLTYLQQGFLDYAQKQFEKTKELSDKQNDSMIILSDFCLGQIALEKGMRWLDQSALYLALKYFSAVLNRAPQNLEVLWRSAQSLVCLREFDSVLVIAQKALALDSARVQFLLLAGYAAHQLMREAQAEQFFAKALTLLPESTVAEYQKVDLLLSPEERRRFARLAPVDQRKTTEMFWRKLDPDLTTDVNERLIEHYSRIFYADLLFTPPRTGLIGHRTKRGEIMIRFGEPQMMWRGAGAQPDTAFMAELSRGIEPPHWLWKYTEGLNETFVFVDYFQNGNFDFPFPEKGLAAGSADYRLYSLTVSTPAVYVPAFEKEPLLALFSLKQFKGQEQKSRLVAYYAISNASLAFAPGRSLARAVLYHSATAYDENWFKVASESSGFEYFVPPTQMNNKAMAALNQISLNSPPGRLRVAFSITDSTTNRRAVLQKEVALYDFHSGLAVSDLVLADLVRRARNERYLTHRGWVIRPNLNRFFFRLRPLHLYFEIYNLVPDLTGKSKYTVTYRLRRLAEKKKGLEKLAGLFAQQKSEQVSQTFQEQSASRDVMRTILIDLSRLAIGHYQLLVEVNDLIGGRKTARLDTLTVTD